MLFPVVRGRLQECLLHTFDLISPTMFDQLAGRKRRRVGRRKQEERDDRRRAELVEGVARIRGEVRPESGSVPDRVGVNVY